MLFGNINRDVTQSEVKIRENSIASAFSFSSGMFYRTEFSENLTLAAGLTYGYGSDLRFRNSLTVTSKEGSTVYKDNIESSRMKNHCKLGCRYFSHCETINNCSDYRYQQWSMIYGNKTDNRFTDTHMINLGAELAPGVSAGRTYARSFKYQAGISVSNFYMTLNGVNPINYEFTAGAAIPFGAGDRVNASLGWGKEVL